MNSLYYLDDDERLALNVVLTDEGVVFDLFVDGELIATRGMTALEWADDLFPPDKPTVV